jgi:endonuclease/exonuclease/phosphatase family metal-dependent hydrolase
MNWFFSLRKMAIFLLYMLQLQLSAGSFQIVTYNIRRDGREVVPTHSWELRRPYITHFINSIEHPAIFGLQEAVRRQIEDIAQACPDYGWIGSGRGKVWFNLGLAKNEYNPIFYKKSDFTLLSSGTFSINKPSLIIKRRREGGLPRICTWGHFREQKTGQELYVYNTHLDSEHDDARFNNLRMIINDIKQRVPAHIPVFLTGDFNMDITAELQTVLDEAHLENTRYIAHQRCTASITHTSWKNNRSNNIDHILVAHLPAHMNIQKHAVVQNRYP